MYPSGLEYDDANNRIVVADTGLDRILFYVFDIGPDGLLRRLRPFDDEDEARAAAVGQSAH